MEITSLQQNIGSAAQSVGSQAGSGNLRPSGGVSPLAAPPVPQQLEQGPDSEAQVAQATEVANRFMDSLSLNLQFSMDKDVNKVVVKVVDTDTHEVIKQFPSEEMLAIAKALDKLQGLLIKTHA